MAENEGAVTSARKTRRGLSVRDKIEVNAVVDAVTPVAKAAGATALAATPASSLAMECDFLMNGVKPMAFFLMNDLSEALQRCVRPLSPSHLWSTTSSLKPSFELHATASSLPTDSITHPPDPQPTRTTNLATTQRSERAELVRAINADTASPVAWKSLLDHVVQHSTKASEAKGRIRICRKAQSLILEADSLQDPAYLAIWLTYASELIDSGENEQKVRQLSYEYMRNKKIGEDSAAFYLHWASFEESMGNAATAREVIDLAMQKSAGGPKKGDLEKARARLFSSGARSGPSVSSPDSSKSAGSASTGPRDDDPPTPTTPTVALSDRTLGQDGRNPSTFELSEIPSFNDLKAQQQQKRAAVTAAAPAPAAMAPPPPPAAAAAAAAATVAAATSSRAATTGLKRSGLKRTGLSARSSVPLRVTREMQEQINEQETVLEVQPPPAPEQQPEQQPAAAAGEATGEELTTLSGGVLEGIAEQSVESSRSSLESSRRDSNSSVASSNASRGSMGSAANKRTSTSSSRSSISFDATLSISQEPTMTHNVPGVGGDDTVVFMKGSSARNGTATAGAGDETVVDMQDVPMEDDTAVVFKRPASRATYSRGGDPTVVTSGGGAVVGNNENEDDETDVIFKGVAANRTQPAKQSSKQPAKQQQQQQRVPRNVSCGEGGRERAR